MGELTDNARTRWFKDICSKESKVQVSSPSDRAEQSDLSFGGTQDHCVYAKFDISLLSGTPSYMKLGFLPLSIMNLKAAVSTFAADIGALIRSGGFRVSLFDCD